jgi:hypothetical protein
MPRKTRQLFRIILYNLAISWKDDCRHVTAGYWFLRFFMTIPHTSDTTEAAEGSFKVLQQNLLRDVAKQARDVILSTLVM